MECRDKQITRLLELGKLREEIIEILSNEDKKKERIKKIKDEIEDINKQTEKIKKTKEELKKELKTLKGAKEYIYWEELPKHIKDYFLAEYDESEKFKKEVADTIGSDVESIKIQETPNFDPETVSKENAEKGIYDITFDFSVEDSKSKKSYFLSGIITLKDEDPDAKLQSISLSILQEDEIKSKIKAIKKIDLINKLENIENDLKEYDAGFDKPGPPSEAADEIRKIINQIKEGIESKIKADEDEKVVQSIREDGEEEAREYYGDELVDEILEKMKYDTETLSQKKTRRIEEDKPFKWFKNSQ